MSKIRHIAYRAADVEATANFFVNALGMNITQRRKNRAIDLSDGTTNITVLPMMEADPNGEAPRQGIDHIGFSAEDDEEPSVASSPTAPARSPPSSWAARRTMRQNSKVWKALWSTLENGWGPSP